MTCHLCIGIKYIKFYLNLWANFSRLWWVEYCLKEDLPWSKNSLSSLGHDFVFLCIRKTLLGASPPLSTLFNPTSPLIPDVWVVHTSSNSVTSAGCSVIQFCSNTIYLELASGPTGLRAQFHKTVPTSDASLKSQVVTCTSDWQA